MRKTNLNQTPTDSFSSLDSLALNIAHTKKVKSIITSGNALLTIQQVLPHKAYHQLTEKKQHKIHISTTLATHDLTGINFYKQRRPTHFSGRKNTYSRKIAMIYNQEEQGLKEGINCYCFPCGFYAKTKYNFGRNNQPKPRDTYFFPSVYYHNKPNSPLISNRRTQLNKEFANLNQRIQAISPLFNYAVIAKETTLIDLKLMNIALSKLRDAGDIQTRLNFNEVCFSPRTNPVAICIPDSGQAVDRIIAYLSSHALVFEYNIHLPVFFTSQQCGQPAIVREYATIDFFIDIRCNNTSSINWKKDLKSFNPKTYNSILNYLIHDYERLYFTPLNHDNPQQDVHERNRLHKIIIIAIIKLKSKIDIQDHLSYIKSDQLSELFVIALENYAPENRHSSRDSTLIISQDNIKRIIKNLSRKQIQSIIDSGVLKNHPNWCSIQLMSHFLSSINSYHIIKANYQQNTIPPLLIKQFCCAFFKSKKSRWKYTFNKVVNVGNINKIQQVLFQSILEQRYLNDEASQRTIMQWFNIDSNFVTYDVFRHAIVTHREELISCLKTNPQAQL